MPVDFLQKQVAGRPRTGRHGQFERSRCGDRRGSRAVEETYNPKVNLLLIRCRLHKRVIPTQLLIALPQSARLGLRTGSGPCLMVAK